MTSGAVVIIRFAAEFVPAAGSTPEKLRESCNAAKSKQHLGRGPRDAVLSSQVR